MPYRPAEDLAKYAKRISESRECLLTGKKAEEFFRNAADIFGVDLDKPYSIKEIRKLPKSKFSLSDLVTEMRAEKYAD